MLETNPHYSHVSRNDGRESIVSVHELAPTGIKYGCGKTEIRKQNTLVEKSTREVREPESDIHFKPLSIPEIHLPVPFDSDDQHSTPIPEHSVKLRRYSRNRRNPLRIGEHQNQSGNKI